MTLRSSHAIGERLAKYRKLAGLSAQQLSDRLGGEMSRSVIANIESGRKSDITVDQLLALAWALNIPPVALAIDTERPFERIRILPGDDDAFLPIYDLVAWFTNDGSLDDLASPPPDVKQASSHLAELVLATDTLLSTLMHHLRLMEEARKSGRPIDAHEVARLKEDIGKAINDMAAFKMDMTMYPVDLAWEKRILALAEAAG